MILLWTTPKKFHLTSWLISKFIGAKYSHTAIVFRMKETGQDIVFHATRKGVYPVLLDDFRAKNKVIESKIILGEKREKKALHFCIEHLGTKYGFSTILSILFNIKFSDGNKRLICSELVAKALDLNLENLDQIDPKELIEILDEV